MKLLSLLHTVLDDMHEVGHDKDALQDVQLLVDKGLRRAVDKGLLQRCY